MKNKVMKNLLRNQRKQLNLKTREVASMLGIDQSLISKFESGDRVPTREQIMLLAQFLQLETDELLALWLKEKLLSENLDYPILTRALRLVEEEQQYYSKQKFNTADQYDLEGLMTLKQELDNLRQYDSYRIAQALEIEYTYESNRIEGNTLTLRETDLVVNHGLTISGKSMREHLEVINHQEAIDYIKEMVLKRIRLTERELLNLHNLILRGIVPEYAGKYRDVQVMISGSAHLPPPPTQVKELMAELFRWYNKSQKLIHPVLLAAEFHQRLVTIHPFVDGNGRVSRLLMNLILLQHGYVIANIKGDERIRFQYYELLEKSQVHGDKSDFIRFVIDVEKACLNRYLRVLS